MRLRAPIDSSYCCRMTSLGFTVHRTRRRNEALKASPQQGGLDGDSLVGDSLDDDDEDEVDDEEDDEVEREGGR